VRDYAAHIWQVQPVDVATARQSQARPPTPAEQRAPQGPGYDLTDAEWQLLAAAPGTIGRVMMALVDSGMIGTLSEEGAIALGPAQAARRYPGNPLIQAVLLHMKEQTRTARERVRARAQRADEAGDPLPHGTRPAGLAEARQLCAQIASLLDRKVPPPQAAEFKNWLLAIAEVVANAAQESPTAGVEGEPEGDLEASALDALAEALRSSERLPVQGRFVV